MAEGLAPTITHDAFFGGRLTLAQPSSGHRSGTDAILLAAAVPRAFVGRVYDVGAGVGAVGLGVALACPAAEVTLIENDDLCVELARANVQANRLQARVAVAPLDILSRVARLAGLPRAADLVVTNPPFHRSHQVRASPRAERRAAHVLSPNASLGEWLQGCLACLAPKGSLIVVHTASAVPEMLDLLASRLGDLTLMPVHPRLGEPATRVLLRGIKGSRAPFRIAAPLVLHEGGGFTPQAAALHAGTAGLAW